VASLHDQGRRIREVRREALSVAWLAHRSGRLPTSELARVGRRHPQTCQPPFLGRGAFNAPCAGSGTSRAVVRERHFHKSWQVVETLHVATQRRGLISIVGALSLLAVLSATWSWQFASDGSRPMHRPNNWAFTACRAMIANAPSAHVLQTAPTIEVLSSERLAPLNSSGVEEAQTWLVLRGGVAERGMICAAATDGSIATVPVEASTGANHAHVAAVFLGSKGRTGYFGIAAHVPESATRVVIVTGRSSQILKPREGLVFCVIAEPMVRDDPLWSGSLTTFDADGHVVQLGAFGQSR